jgi:hypothetical protein
MEVDDAFAGRAARCPTCGYDFRVPKTGEATPVRGVETPARPGATTVKVGGERVEIVPPLETMAIVSVAAGGFSIVVVAALAASGLLSRGWAVWFAGAAVALLGTMIGIPAYHSIKRSRGKKRGRLLATIGLLGGAGLFLVFAVGMIIGIAREALKPPCEQNLEHIHAALMKYAKEHNGDFPPKLETLVNDKYLDGVEWLICPERRSPPGQITYIMTPDININNPLFPADLVIASDDPLYVAHGDNFVRAVLLDGKPITIPAAKWADFQQKQAARWNEILNKIRNPKAAAPPKTETPPQGAPPVAPSATPPAAAAPAPTPAPAAGVK